MHKHENIKVLWGTLKNHHSFFVGRRFYVQRVVKGTTIQIRTICEAPAFFSSKPIYK